MGDKTKPLCPECGAGMETISTYRYGKYADTKTVTGCPQCGHQPDKADKQPAAVAINMALVKQLSEATQRAERLPRDRKIVCLCGRTKFYRTFDHFMLRFSKQGCIVLTLGSHYGSDDDLGVTPDKKQEFYTLHRAKIDLSDEVFVLDVHGEIGPGTKAEIEYAKQIDKPVRYLSQEFPDYQEPVDTLRAQVEALTKERDGLKTAYTHYMDKTEWIQDAPGLGKWLGHSRIDILNALYREAKEQWRVNESDYKALWTDHKSLLQTYDAAIAQRDMLAEALKELRVLKYCYMGGSKCVLVIDKALSSLPAAGQQWAAMVAVCEAAVTLFADCHAAPPESGPIGIHDSCGACHHEIYDACALRPLKQALKVVG